ncbi:transposase, partial [Frankia sp. Cas4]|uniref:transposase n=1 Tax=Frankia sp. Cas4 TaxID=3073927 RepID=UPI002AD1F94E
MIRPRPGRAGANTAADNIAVLDEAITQIPEPYRDDLLSLFEQHEGFRFQVTATNLPTGRIPFLEACHRVQARVESRIRCGKDTGLRWLPSHKFTISSVWCVAVGMACDLLAWPALLGLDGELAKAEPETVRYRLLHTAGRIIHGQPRRRLRIPETRRWADALATAFTRIQALPAPDRHTPTAPTRRKDRFRPVEPAPTRP